MGEHPNAKVALTSDDGEVETLWAFDLGAGRYRLDNLPWYAYGVSAADVIEAKADENGQLHFVRVLEKSGNRTVRVILQIDQLTGKMTFDSQRVLPAVEALGCSWEGASASFIAVNIPPTVDLAAVTEALNERDVEWEYADPTPEEMGIVPEQDDGSAK